MVPEVIDEDLAIGGSEGEGRPVRPEVNGGEREVGLEVRHRPLHLDVVADAPLVQATGEHKHLKQLPKCSCNWFFSFQ